MNSRAHYMSNRTLACTGPVIKNIDGSEDPLMHKAEGPSNYFFQLFHTLSS